MWNDFETFLLSFLAQSSRDLEEKTRNRNIFIWNPLHVGFWLLSDAGKGIFELGREKHFSMLSDDKVNCSAGRFPLTSQKSGEMPANTQRMGPFSMPSQHVFPLHHSFLLHYSRILSFPLCFPLDCELIIWSYCSFSSQHRAWSSAGVN